MKLKPKRTFSWMNPKLEVRSAPKYGKGGKGVFAKAEIKKGELLSIHGGYIISRKEEQKLPKKFSDQGTQISEDFVISSGTIDEADGYFNHSCNPSAGYKGQIFLVAMRKIKSGEEITFDYGMVLHRSKGAKAYKMKCNCGNENCRGVITDDDWKIKSIQKKYKGYFQWYLEEKINNIIRKK